MRSEPSKVKTVESRTRSLAGRRRGAARNRKQKQRQAYLETLEQRLVMSVLPPALVSTQVAPTQLFEPSNSNNSSPSIAVDPTNANHIAMVWQSIIPNPGATPAVIIRIDGAFSPDGGTTWTQFSPVNGVMSDPTTSNPTVPYTRVTDGTVDFDRNGNFYVLVSEHNDGNTSGALVLSKFASAGGGATNVFSNEVLYGWTQDQAEKPTLAVDKSVATFTDVNSTGQTVTQTDASAASVSSAGSVYVAWATNDTAPSGAVNWNPNSTKIIGSSDGGLTFTGPQTIGFGNFGSQRETGPRLIVGQGTATASGVTATVAGGLVTVVWDDYGSGATATPTPYDNIYTKTYTGAVGLTVNATTGPIADASTTPFAFVVSAGTNFTVSDVSVSVALTHAANAQLTLALQAPDGTIVNLVNNNTASGANFGYGGISTIFSMSATKGIASGAAPYLGMFRPAGGPAIDPGTGGPINLATFNNKPLQTGTWHLLITDSTVTTPTPPQFLSQATLNLSGGMVPGTAILVARTTVRGQEGEGGVLASAAAPQGIGPSPSLASDNTLGAYSPHEGRLYLTYVDRFDPNAGYLGNPADNTDVFLITSDNGGRTWINPATGRSVGWGYTGAMVNNDNATSDGFSSANDGKAYSAGDYSGRPQFEPSVAVDQGTGALVVSYYDTRYDAARARVATSIQTSLDGGATFSASAFANTPLQVHDQATGQVETLGPIPDNMSSGNNMTGKDTVFGFGNHEGLAVLDGHVYPAWSSNLNGGNGVSGNNQVLQLLQIRVAQATIADGPRILSGSSGAVGRDANGNQLSPLPLNQTTAADGTPIVQAFTVTFDRPIDPATFLPADVLVYYHDTTAGDPLVPVPVTSVTPVATGVDGATQFLIRFTPSSNVGTYSYAISAQMQDRIRSLVTQIGNFGPRVTVSTGLLLPPLVIPNLGSAMSTLTLAGFDGYFVGNMRVNVSIQDTFDSNLQIYLIAPDGISVLLSNREGGSGQNFTNTTFSDAAGTAIGAGTAPFTGSYKPDQALDNVTGKAINGTWSLMVVDAAVPNVGALLNWSLNFQPTTPVPNVSVTGNKMDQNSNAKAGETTDFFAMPTPTGTSPFTGPFLTDTLPLVVPGPHVVGMRVQNDSGTADHMVADNTASYLDVTFDRDINASTFDGSKVLRIQGPYGLISGPFTVVPLTSAGVESPGLSVARTFRIKFPTQWLSGTYTVELDSSIQSTTGLAVDSNLNAGVAVLRGTSSNPPVTLNYPTAVAVPIAAQSTVTSPITVNSDFYIQNLTVTVNISYPTDSDLTLTLIAPDGTRILLASGVGTTPPNFANFSGTIFDDGPTSTTPISNGTAPFFGRFISQSVQLGTLTGKSSVKGPGGTGTGVWQLEVTNAGTSTGSITGWTLTLQKAVPSSGLGEPVADRTPLAFRIFTMGPTNSLASQTWTSVGPASINGNSVSSRIGGLAVDPSDPSGNTVYVAGASGGVWKTTNFLTTSSGGPTYIPLTDFGPTFGVNIGGIAVFGRNNDPNQSIIFVATGEGDTGSPGVGFLRSMDGGATWTLLDSTDNTLPFAQRDHAFDGTTSAYQIVVDPRPTPSGNVVVYAALSGANGGIWRSLDSGMTWGVVSSTTGKRVANLVGQATDVVLDPASGTVDAVSNPTGNLQTVYGALRGQGVYISPNQGQVWNLMSGGVGVPLEQDPSISPAHPIPVTNNTASPNGPQGRIVLAKPALTGNKLEDAIYEGWLYAFVASPSGTEYGLFVTKDQGQNWTKISLPTLPFSTGNNKRAVPTNDTTQPQYDVLSAGGLLPAQGNYDISITIDPVNPNIVYLGGMGTQVSGMIRVDITGLADPHALYLASNRPDGGTLYVNATDPVALKQNPLLPPSGIDPRNPAGVTGAQVDMIRNPSNPLGGNGTFYVSNTASISNSGDGATWIPFDIGIGDYHRAISMVDPLTGLSRIVFGDDHGLWTVVDNGDGTLSSGIGTQAAPTGARSGNLQITQFYYGAAQPSSAAAQIAQALFFGQAQDNGSQHSGANVLTPGTAGYGNIYWNGPIGDGGGVATDQTGSGTSYRYNWPCCGGNTTDFFQISQNANYNPPATPGGAIGITNGLIQASGTGGVPDPQWPLQGGFNFAVNPVNGNQIVITSGAGRVFRTLNALNNTGVTWFSIAEPSVLDGTVANALAFGAPDFASGTTPAAGQLGDFIYAGTNGGHIYVTFTGGGSGQGNAWNNISAGLDGSAVQMIVTDPTRTSHEAYAVTSNGVYYMANSAATGATWVNITGNLFSIKQTPFGNSNLVGSGTLSTRLKALTSIQADWRYSIPDNPANPTGPAHPMLYIAGNGGVYRSIDKGATWMLFPLLVETGSLNTTAGLNIPGGDGGALPNAKVTDLSMSIGNVDPTTGFAIAAPGDPNILAATTYGRGTFAIRLAPVVFASQLELDTTLPPPNGSLSGNLDAAGLPIVNISQPVIDGNSEQTAHGNTVTINLYDLTGYVSGTPLPTPIGTGTTDTLGNFSIQINPYVFSTAGVKTIGVQATDQSGTQGNIAEIKFDLEPPVTPNQGTKPTAPSIKMNQADDTSNGLLITTVAQPRFIGVTYGNPADGPVTVQLFLTDGRGNQLPWPTGVATPTFTADALGNYTLQFPNLGDGSYIVDAVATNANGSTVSTSTVSFTIQRTPTAPTISMDPADDSSHGSLVTNVIQPHFLGATTTSVTVQLFPTDSSGNPIAWPIGVATPTTTSDPITGKYTLQFPNLGAGTFTVDAVASNSFGSTPSATTVTFTIVLTPVPPTIRMNPADDSSHGSLVTNNPAPRIIGVTSPGVSVALVLLQKNGLSTSWAALGITPPAPVTSDSSGNYSITFPNLGATGNATWTVQTVATNTFGSSNSATNLTFTIKQTLTTPVVLGLGTTPATGTTPADDTGIPGDWVTSNRFPNFMGTADPNAVVQVYRVDTSTTPATDGPVLATVMANAQGNFSFQLPQALSNGTITLQANETDLAGNVGPVSNLAVVTVVTTQGDFIGAGNTTPAVFRRAASGTGLWIAQGTVPKPVLTATTPGWTTTGVSPVSTQSFGSSAYSIPFIGDFDGDGITDVATYTPSTNTWDINRSQAGEVSVTLDKGQPGDIPFVGDFDGDGKTDFGVYTPLTGTWTISESTGGTVALGPIPGVTPMAGDIPVPGDYQSPGTATTPRAELAIYRPLTGTFYIDGSTGVFTVKVTTGTTGDVPVPGDYNNSYTPGSQPIASRITEPAVFNPTTGAWEIAVYQAATNTWVSTPVTGFQPGDVPAPGDYLGTGSLQPAVYRFNTSTTPPTATLYINNFNNGGTITTQTTAAFQPGDIPLTAPLAYRTPIAQPTLTLAASSNTGFKTDNVTSGFWLGAYRYITLTGTADPGSTVAITNLNASFTIIPALPVPASGTYSVSIGGFFNGTYNLQAVEHSLSGAASTPSTILPVTLITTQGDYTGTGQTTLAVFNRTSTAMGWTIQGLTSSTPLPFGSSTLAIPLAGDFAAFGKTDLVYYDTSTAQWFAKQAAFGYQPNPNSATPYRLATWGWAGVDIPVPADFNGDGMTDFATYRPVGFNTGSDGLWSIAYNYVGGTRFVTITGAGYKPAAGDVPVPGNYDNVGHAELAIYRPSTGQWFISSTTTGSSATVTRLVTFGANTASTSYVPVPGAYDATAGNPSIEPAVFDTNSGKWFVDATTQRSYQFLPGDIPAPGDYFGTGVTEPAVYRPGPGNGTWWVVKPNATTPTLLVTGTFGTTNDIPINSPYHYRQIASTKGTVGALKVAAPASATLDLGSSAHALSSGSASSVAAPTSVNVSTPARGRHVNPLPKAPALDRHQVTISHALATKKKTGLLV
jgi:subtilisin-like proprotein convertase family protein